MNKNVLFLAGILILTAGAFFVLGSNGNSATGNSIVDINPDNVQGQMQQVVLSQKDFNYKDAIVEANKPISISADNSVSGCLRSVSFNIDGRKYSKYLRTPEETLELPALSKGVYSFSCSMGMGYGKLIVE
nr:cupredoxin domain-containing protein [Candidatus Woesearchaeota archaeon]